MTIDERHIAPTVDLAETIDRLGDKLDADRRAILADFKSVDDEIRNACRAKDYGRAEAGYQFLAEVFRSRHFPGEAGRYRVDAKEMRKLKNRAERERKGART